MHHGKFWRRDKVRHRLKLTDDEIEKLEDVLARNRQPLEGMEADVKKKRAARNALLADDRPPRRRSWRRWTGSRRRAPSSGRRESRCCSRCEGSSPRSSDGSWCSSATSTSGGRTGATAPARTKRRRTKV